MLREDLVIKSDGEDTRSFCYISDAITGLLKVLLLGNNNEAYNIGNPEQTYKIKELAKILCEIDLGYKANIVFKQNLNKNYLKSKFKIHSPDIKKLNSLNWTPKINVKEGFERTIKSYEI